MDENTQNNDLGNAIKGALTGERPLVTTSNEITLNEMNIAKNAAIAGGIWLLFVVLASLAKVAITKNI